MQEIEAKFYVTNLKKMEMCLQDLDAHLIQPRVLETNIRFDLPDGSLTAERRVLRLRQDTKARMTYKGIGSNEQGILNRNEIEFVVDDYDKAKQLIEALGYQQAFYYEKYRTTYELDECHIMIDELPIGNFIEIEGESIQSIQAFAKKLNLKTETAVPASYHMLFKAYCEKHAELDSSNLSFDALRGARVSPEELLVRSADI
jgi:adenylate cyclase class 2